MATGRDLSHSLLNASDEIAEAPCIFCYTRDDKQVESTHFCVDCDVKICKDCTKWHQSFPALYKHQIGVVTMTTGTSENNAPSLPKEICEEHHGRLIDYFCQTHDKLCCAFCVATKHRECRGVKYLPTLAKGIKSGIAFKKVKASAQIHLQELKEERSSRHGILQCIYKENGKSQKSLHGLQTRLIKRIDDIIKAESDKIKTKYQKKREAVQEDIQAIALQLDAIETSEKNLNEAEGDNETQLFVYIKQGEESKIKCMGLMNTLKQSSQAQLLHYKISDTLEHDICSKQRLGKFDIYTIGKGERAVQLAYEAEYNIKSAMDRQDCDISGLCILSDASVVLADSSNNCLKQFDTFFRLTNTVAMSSLPNDICYISKTDEVAVSFYDEENIPFFSVGATMAQTRSFQHFTIECRGICYSQDELFLLCSDICVNIDTVRVFTLSGQILRTIPYEYHLNYITVNPDDSKLHAADMFNVVTMDRNGKLLRTYSLPDTTGICTFDDDSFLVTSKITRSVQHVSSNGTKRDVVFEKLADMPKNVWYDSATNRILLRTESRNTLKAYIVG